MTKVSFIIPMHNEGENVNLMFDRLNKVIKDNKINSEVILIDDNSNDNSNPMIVGSEDLENYYDDHTEKCIDIVKDGSDINWYRNDILMVKIKKERFKKEKSVKK